MLLALLVCAILPSLILGVGIFALIRQLSLNESLVSEKNFLNWQLQSFISPVKLYDSLATYLAGLKNQTSSEMTTIAELLQDALREGVHLSRPLKKMHQVVESSMQQKRQVSLVASRLQIHSVMLIATNLLTKCVFVGACYYAKMDGYDVIFDMAVSCLGSSLCLLAMHRFLIQLPSPWARESNKFSQKFIAWLRFELLHVHPAPNQAFESDSYSVWSEYRSLELLNGSDEVGSKDLLKDHWLSLQNFNFESRIQVMTEISSIFEFALFLFYSSCFLSVCILTLMSALFV